MSNTMAIWNEVQKTDPKYTKEYSGAGGFSGTAISGHYMVMKATEMFGPIGIGWGYTIEEERYDSGAAVSWDADGNETARAMTHVMRLKLWFDNGGQRGEVEHFGITPYVYTSGGYNNKPLRIITDHEAPKKSLTDALKKCLSMIGFGADVYLGEFDDEYYVQTVSSEFEIERAENKDEERERQRQAYLHKMEQLAKQIREAVNITMLKAVFKEAVRKANYRNDTKMVARINELYEERLAALQQTEEKEGGK